MNKDKAMLCQTLGMLAAMDISPDMLVPPKQQRIVSGVSFPSLKQRKIRTTRKQRKQRNK